MTGPVEATHETFLRHAQAMPKGSTIVGDSLFGGTQTAETLINEGYHVLLSCTSQRPSAVFKDYLCKELSEDNTVATQYGSVPDPDGEQVPLVFNTFLSKNKRINTISSVFSAKPVTKEVETLCKDEDHDSQQNVAVNGEESRPECRVMYGFLMDFVDQADAEIASLWIQTRKRSWSTAYVMWIFTMLLGVNAQRVHQVQLPPPSFFPFPLPASLSPSIIPSTPILLTHVPVSCSLPPGSLQRR